MIRKVSTKAPLLDERTRKLELKTSDNEYYLPHPHPLATKTPLKDQHLQYEKDKLHLKNPRKHSHNPPTRTYSTSNFKLDIHNLSKDNDPPNLTRNNMARKVQSRKLRCTSNVQTPRKMGSKSSFKVQLNTLKKQGGNKRLHLKIEAPTAKRQVKVNPHSTNFDSYYNNEGPNLQLRTARSPKRAESSRSGIESNNQLGIVYSRCKRLMEEYKVELEETKKENRLLRQENQRLLGQN